MAINNPATRLNDDGNFEVAGPSGLFETVMGPREIFLPANIFLTHTGSGALTGTAAGSGNIPGWALDTTSDETLSTVVILPDSWNTFKAEVFWSNASTGAGTVRWDIIYEFVAAAAAVATGTTVSATTAAAPTTAFQIVSTEVAGEGIGTAVEGRICAVRLNRDANHAADTVANDVSFHGILLTRSS